MTLLLSNVNKSSQFKPLLVKISTKSQLLGLTVFAFRGTNGDFYVASGSSMGLALLVWVGGGLLKRVL